jgi:hypothetical protein
LRTLLGAPPKRITTRPVSGEAGSLYAQVVQPILQRRCISCHGPEKQKGELRLDSLAGVRRGGQAGLALVPGNASESLMIRRLLLPPEDEDHMPPEGKPQPTQAEVGLLQWWINAGASEDGTLASIKPDADILRMIEEVRARQTR